MLSETEIEALAQKTVALFNRVRTPEINAKLVFFSPYMLTISFTGGFCYGCGVLQYVQGFAEQFKGLSGKADLKASKTRQINSRIFETDFIIRPK
jgi:hypothetical protein